MALSSCRGIGMVVKNEGIGIATVVLIFIVMNVVLYLVLYFVLKVSETCINRDNVINHAYFYCELLWCLSRC